MAYPLYNTRLFQGSFLEADVRTSVRPSVVNIVGQGPLGL